MEEVVLAFGSNQGDRTKNLLQAYDLINERCGKIIRLSGNLENNAVGFESEDLFLNSCALIQSELKPDELLKVIKEIESELGRQPLSADGYSSRPIDIDIIFFGEQIIQTDKIQIPHTQYKERLFVLEPLASIYPQKTDPRTGESVYDLLKSLKY
jgi:2-amino-4-hydroxy-6-hydroxymethyldihydropteridine diphosphokinase